MSGFKKALFIAAAPALAFLAVWGFGELALRAVIRQKLIYNIEMVKYAKLLKMRDPEGLNSHVHRANAAARLMGVDVALNSLGHRSKEPAPKTAGLKKVLVLGSSVTMGWGVPQDQVFTALVESRLNKEKPFGDRVAFEFANAGIGNYDSLAQLNLLKRQYRAIAPDAVVLHYFISDAEPRGKGSNNPILKHSYLAAYFYDRARLVRMRAEKKLDLAEHYSALYRGDNGAWAKTRGYIAEMREVARKDRVPFIIMIIPDVHNLRPDTPYAEIYARLEKDFNAMGLKTLNAFGAFQSRFGEDEKALWIQADDPHPNAQGHAVMAELLYKFIVAENPLGLARRHARARAV